MYIEKVGGKDVDVGPIPSVSSTLEQSSTLPINNNNKSDATPVSKSTKEPSHDDVKVFFVYTHTILTLLSVDYGPQAIKCL